MIKNFEGNILGSTTTNSRTGSVEMAHRLGTTLSSSSMIPILQSPLGLDNTTNKCGVPKVFNKIDDSCVIQVIPANTTTAPEMLPNVLLSFNSTFESCTDYSKSSLLGQNGEGNFDPLTGSAPREEEEDQLDQCSMTKKKGRPFGSKNKKKGINPPTIPDIPSSSKAVSCSLTLPH